MITRRAVIGTLAGSLLTAPVEGGAQSAGRTARIGYLYSGADTAGQHLQDAFRQGLRELGWVEGRNIVIEYRFAEGRFDRLPGLAAELVRLKVDVLVGFPTPASVAAKSATGTIPIVMVAVSDPVELGLVQSLARPGGNVTGVTYGVGAELFGKHLELLREAVPNVRRVAVLSNPSNPTHARAMSNVKTAARPLGTRLQLLEVRGPDEFEGAFSTMVQGSAEALLVVSDSLFTLHRARLGDLVVRNRLPSMHGVMEQVEAGGLMSYGARLLDLCRRAATYVDRILKGAKPADLPVEQPTKFELVINLKTAKALGLTIPPSLLARVDEVIQ